MIGVSPAYMISRWTDRFSFNHMTQSLHLLKDSGFEAMQIEVFHRDQLEVWTDENSELLKNTSIFTGIKLSQFVAHFLLNAFVSPESLSDDTGLDEITKISLFLHRFGLTDIVTVPLGAFQGVFTPKIREDFINKLTRMKERLDTRNQKLAVEPLPGSLGADLGMLEEIPGLVLNLDPGHLLCSGINPFDLKDSILKKVYATHLCDNDGVTNTSSVPGSFHSAEEWKNLMDGLADSGYQGTFDLEIICPACTVEEQYREGRNFIANFEYNIVNSK